MNLRVLPFIIFTFASLNIFAQTEINISKFIKLPKDSIQSSTLISALNNFLISTQKENENNSYVYPREKVETFILIDEFKNIEKSGGFKN